MAVVDLPLLFTASGQGIVTARSSWARDASHLMVHFPPRAVVDHAVNYSGDFQLYRQGSWALTHPITYGGPGGNGEGINAMLHCGFGAPVEYRGPVTVTQDADGLRISGTSGGAVNGEPYYFPPPTWWHEFSRVILWRWTPAVDTLIVFDRSHVDDPQKLPNFVRYSAANQARIKANPLRQWRWHMPVEPLISDGRVAQWPIPSGYARLTWTRADLVPEIVDQRVAWPSAAIATAEKQFHLTLTPPNVPGFQTNITIVQCGDVTKFDEVPLPTFNTTPGPTLPSPTTNTYDPRVPDLLRGIAL